MCNHVLLCQRVVQKEILNPDKELAPEEPVMEAVAAEASVVGKGMVHFPGCRVGPSFMSPSDLKVN